MAEDTDDSQKTEEPSWRKLDEARQKGQVPQSREVSNWFIIVGATGSMLLFAPQISGAMQRAMLRFIEQSSQMRLDGAFHDAMLGTLSDVAFAMAPAFLVLMVTGLAGTLLQTGIIFAPNKLAPKLEHLSIGQGIHRMFSMRAFVEFFKGLLKITLVGSVAGYLLLPELDRLPLLPSLGTGVIGHEIMVVSLRVAIGVITVLALIAIADFTYQRLSFIRSMRMSKQEVREEYKQVEGNPFIKSRLRQIRTERARRRMMAAVPSASVVITNPTHFAVALRYEMNAQGAPLVVAKGADLVAARIREVARENDVPIVENPPVARALYAAVEIDDEVPAEHYKAVAEIISYVFRLKGKLKPR